MKNKVSWKFPTPKAFFHRIEVAFLAVVAVIIFVGSFFYFDQHWAPPIFLTAIFLLLYILSAAIIKEVHKAEAHFTAHKTHLEIAKKTRFHRSHVKVPFKHIVHHKVDKVFLGGYVQTHQGKRHQLYFNNKKEAVDLEKHLHKHVKVKKH